MQKLVTIAIDTTQLNPGKASPIAVNEIEEINELLELGWEIQEWDFLKEGEADGQVVLMVTLNDDPMFENDEDDFDTDFDDAAFDYRRDDEDEEEEKNSLKNKN